MLVTMSVLEAKSCGAETVPELVTSPHAARRHSAARGREGAVQALAVQRARGGRPGDGQRGARERPSPRLLRPRPSMSPWTRRPPW